MKNSKTIVLSIFAAVILFTGILVWTFKYASVEMAAKTCFFVAHQLQNDFYKKNTAFAPEIKDLDGLDQTCVERFHMTVLSPNPNEFQVRGTYGPRTFSIDQMGEWKKSN